MTCLYPFLPIGQVGFKGKVNQKGTRELIVGGFKSEQVYHLSYGSQSLLLITTFWLGAQNDDDVNGQFPAKMTIRSR